MTAFFPAMIRSKRAYDARNLGLEKDEKGVPKKDPTLPGRTLRLSAAQETLLPATPRTRSPRSPAPRRRTCWRSTGLRRHRSPGQGRHHLYAMGWTQHTVGVQNIRAMSIIQMLLGNMGMAGGGVNALRGESNVQGSTDHGLLFHILPGYIPSPRPPTGRRSRTT